MEKINLSVTNFLLRHDMYFDENKIAEYAGYFIDDMRRGLEGKESSLKMIPTYINAEDKIPVNEEVIVLDAGGTNFRNAIVYFNEKNEAIIKNFNQFSMPGVSVEIDKDDFFEDFVKKSNDILNKSGKIGFCFSYPTDILPNKDGRLVCLSKEMKVKNLIGELIGENLNKKIKEHGFSEKRITILNDTVTALLAGMSNSSKGNYSSYLGFILGTGTNVCYLEKNKNIKKENYIEKEKEQVINIEAGNFNRLPIGDFDKELDKALIDKGSQFFEKMVAGRYFGSLCLTAFKNGIKENLFSEESSNRLQKIKDLTTAEVNDFIVGKSDDANNLAIAIKDSLNDKDILKSIIELLIDRSAKLATIVLSGTILKIKNEINLYSSGLHNGRRNNFLQAQRVEGKN